MFKKRMFILIPIFVIVLFIVGFFIPRETTPSPDTRIILEHTYETYIAPRCFEQSDATNYIQDSTLEKALDSQYEAHDTCTEKALQSETDNLYVSLLKDIGIIEKTWDNW